MVIRKRAFPLWVGHIKIKKERTILAWQISEVGLILGRNCMTSFINALLPHWTSHRSRPKELFLQLRCKYFVSQLHVEIRRCQIHLKIAEQKNWKKKIWPIFIWKQKCHFMLSLGPSAESRKPHLHFTRVPNWVILRY